MRPPISICLRCQSRLAVARAISARLPLWQATPRFIAIPTTAGSRTPRDRAVRGGKEEDELIRIVDHHGTTPTKSPWAEVAPETMASRPRRRNTKARGVRALEMFESAIEKQQNGDPTPFVALQPSVSLQVYEDFAKFAEMRSRDSHDTAACFDFFYTNIYPHVKSRGSIPHTSKGHVSGLLADVSNAKTTRGPSAGALPTATQITQIRRELGMLNQPDKWAPLILGLLEEIWLAGNHPAGHADSILQTVNPPAVERADLIDDLLGAWRMFCLPDIAFSNQEQLENMPTNFRLPLLDPSVVRKAATRKALNLAIAGMFPRYAPRQLHGVGCALAASLHLLTDSSMCSPTAQQAAKEFLDAAGSIFSVWRLDSTTLLNSTILQPFPHLKSYLSPRYKSTTPRRTVSPSPRQSGSGPNPDMQRQRQRLSQALRFRNLAECEQVWAEFWGPEPTPTTTEDIQMLQQHADMFDYFIMIFTSMRQEDKANMVWGSLAKVQLVPTLKTWTSYMEGCKLARNAAGIRHAWAKLVETGLQLDVAVWTARVSGLIQAGAPAEGLAVLAEMQAVWNRSQQEDGPSPAAVQPTIAPVNAAVAGMLRVGGLSAVGGIIQWAAREGISPDSITFNILLETLLKKGQEDQFAQVLAMMKEYNVPPTEETFTILLDAMMTGIGDKTAEQQVEVVTRILSEMEASGLEKQHMTIAKLLHLLLRHGRGTRGAVDAVLRHMEEKSVKPSAHICSILIDQLFSINPPDLQAVERFISSHQLYEYRGLDRVFWERVVRGYARAGDIKNALKYFARIENSLSVTPSTVEALLEALINQGKMQEATSLVRQVRSQTMLSLPEGHDHSQARVWKHHFWHLAAKHGLLEAGGEGEVDDASSAGKGGL